MNSVNPDYAEEPAVRDALNLDGDLPQVVLMTGTFRGSTMYLGTIAKRRAYADALTRQVGNDLAVLGSVNERKWIDVEKYLQALKAKP